MRISDWSSDVCSSDLLRQLVETILRDLDLLGRLDVEVVVEGVVHHVLAERDELAAQVEVVDGLAVVGGIDDGDVARLELGQILRAADVGQRALLDRKSTRLNSSH